MTLLLCLLCLLLCGCAQEAPSPDAGVPTQAAPVCMYDPTAPQEAAYQGALRVYPLTMRKTQGLLPWGEDLLAFSGYGSTTLTLLTGEDLAASASLTLAFELSPSDPSLQVHEDLISFYDPTSQKIRILNRELRETSYLFMAVPIQGSPILSQNRSTLYYCTGDAILAWDLDSGIHRTVKELRYDAQVLTGLHLDGTVLQCRIQDRQRTRTLFLDTATGRILSQQAGQVRLSTLGGSYYATLDSGGLDLLLFGQTEGSPQILCPQNPPTSHFFLPQRHAAVTASYDTEDRTVLTWYSLTAGVPSATLTLDPLQSPKSIVSTDSGHVYILTYDPAADRDTVYRWDADAPVFASGASVCCTGDYTAFREAAPEDLAQCLEYAAQISEAYGIQVHIGEEAAAIQPWDYSLEAETLPRILMQELTMLDQRLSQYPPAVLEQTIGRFSSLHLSLVRQITGTASSGSLGTATGVQFLEGSDVYIAIAAGTYSQQALYHELYHVMETHILTESSAMDQWNEWNPEFFSYSFTNTPKAGWEDYLSGEKRAFIDSYSMTAPKEDRARVFEYAMLPGNADVFACDALQTKLSATCQAIREAYGLEKAAEVFPWEQYLDVPLAYPAASP